MQARKILFPTDFSPASDAALGHASAMARGTGAELIILHVEEPPLAYGSGEMYYGVSEFNTETIRKMLDAVKPTAADIRVVRRLEIGDPAAEIVRVAKDENVDMIVMGTHGRTGLLRLLMGSVAELVVRRAHCNVLTVRRPEQATPKS